MSKNLQDYISYFGKQGDFFHKNLAVIDKSAQSRYKMTLKEKDEWLRKYDRCYKECRILARYMTIVLEKYQEDTKVPEDKREYIQDEITRVHNLTQRVTRDAKKFFTKRS